MPQPTIEERVAMLEKQLADLKATVEKFARQQDWRRTVGIFPEDEILKRIDEEGRKWREREREKARRRPVKSARTRE